MIQEHWILVSSCWQYPNRSLLSAVKTVRRQAMNLVSAFVCGSARRIIEAIETIGRSLTVAAKINKRKFRPHTYPLLLDKSRASSEGKDDSPGTDFAAVLV